MLRLDRMLVTLGKGSRSEMQKAIRGGRVRVKDVSMYEYRVGQPAAPKAEEEKVEAEVAAEAQAKAEA